MPEGRSVDRHRKRPIQPWGEVLFFLVVSVVLGSALFGAVWTRIEEFEKGVWDSFAITQTIVLGLILIGLVIGVFVYLSRRVRD
jgi:peptidoglycan biosynthesis protein MviN/MurJ (putative lipid II flippase)